MKRFGKLLALTAIVSVLGVSIPFQSFAASIIGNDLCGA